MMPAPTVPPPRAPNLSSALTRNIAALKARRNAARDARSWGERFADVMTRVAGSMLFVYLHAAVYGAWIAVNLLAEHELTKVASMVASVMEHLGIEAYQDQEVGEITQDIAPEAVLDELEQEGTSPAD